MSAGQLSDESVQYLQDKAVPTLMEQLLHDLLLALPADPLGYLQQLLESKPRPKIVIAGPPAGGKGTQCELIAKKYGVVHISTGDILREHTKQGTALGKKASEFMTKGQLVPDSLIIEIVKERLNQPDVKAQGWLLDGFPRTRAQAMSLQVSGVIPNVFLVLDVPDEVVIGRISGRRTDPKTGAVYHMTTNPPPAGLAVEQRADDTPAAISVRLGLFHRNMTDVLACYESLSVLIDGNRDKTSIFQEIEQQIDARFVQV
jgi:adenylate kinase